MMAAALRRPAAIRNPSVGATPHSTEANVNTKIPASTGGGR